jgi:hypothetical protein
MESKINRTLSKLDSSFDERRSLLESRGSSKLVSLTDHLAIMGAVLQQPTQFFSEIYNSVNLFEKILTLFTTSAIFLMIYGAVLGVGHPLLSLGAAVAIPLLFLGSLATCIPVMYLLDILSGSQRSLSQMIAILLTSVNAAAVVFFSFAPIMVLFRLTGTLYQILLLNIGILALATLVGLVYVTKGLIQTANVDPSHNLGRLNRLLHFFWMLLFLIVTSQMAWSMLAFFQRTGGFFGLFL